MHCLLVSFYFYFKTHLPYWNPGKKQSDEKGFPVFMLRLVIRKEWETKKWDKKSLLWFFKISRHFSFDFSHCFPETKQRFKLSETRSHMKHLSRRLWHNAVKNKLGSSRGGERELVSGQICWWKFFDLTRNVLWNRVVGARRRATSTLGTHAWKRREGRRRRRRRGSSKSFGDFKSRSTPWPREKLHGQSWALRQLGPASKSGSSPARVLG